MLLGLRMSIAYNKRSKHHAMSRILTPATILFFLSPAIAELLSGSAPPAEFFSPFGFAVMTALYGSGAVLSRELLQRWRKGWPSLLALGAAYGILEEGLMVKSFFSPYWEDLGILNSYGRWGGVNWVWSVELTIYHALISIAIPILLVELIFPAQRHEPWIGRLGFGICTFLLVADTIFGFLAFPYQPSWALILLTMAVIARLIALARVLPAVPFAPREAGPRHPFWFWLTGFGSAVCFFIVFFVLPHTPLHPLLTIAVGLGIGGLVTFLLLRMSGNGATWRDGHRLALAGGALGFMIALTPLHELDATRPDNTCGMTLVGLATVAFLMWVWRQVRRGERVSSGSTVG